MRHKKLHFIVTMRAKFHQECPTGKWKRLRKHWRARKIIFDTAQNAKKMHPTSLENTAIPHFEIKITEIHFNVIGVG